MGPEDTEGTYSVRPKEESCKRKTGTVRKNKLVRREPRLFRTKEVRISKIREDSRGVSTEGTNGSRFPDGRDVAQ